MSESLRERLEGYAQCGPAGEDFRRAVAEVLGTRMPVMSSIGIVSSLHRLARAGYTVAIDVEDCSVSVRIRYLHEYGDNEENALGTGEKLGDALANAVANYFTTYGRPLLDELSMRPGDK